MSTTTYAPTVIDRLNAEWAVRYAETSHPWPHGAQTGIELVQTVARSTVEVREQIMRGLLEQAAVGDEDCARAVLQLMLPRFTLIAGRHTRMRMATMHGDHSAREEVSAAVIAAAWKWIRRPSLHRAGSCIGNLAMDVLKDSLLERKLYDGQSDVEALPSWLPQLAEEPADDEAADNGRATRDLCALIAWARDNAVFSSRDAAVFLRYQLADEEVSAAVIAAAWKWIRRPSLHRAGSCIGNLAMDVLKDSLLERKLYDGQSDVEALPSWLPQLAEEPADDEAADNGRATRDLCALIAWARDNAVFSSRDAAVFLRYQLADEAERAALSDEYGYSGRGLCKRINVLRTRLTQAVKDYAMERSGLAPDYAALMEQAPAA